MGRGEAAERTWAGKPQRFAVAGSEREEEEAARPGKPKRREKDPEVSAESELPEPSFTFTKAKPPGMACVFHEGVVGVNEVRSIESAPPGVGVGPKGPRASHGAPSSTSRRAPRVRSSAASIRTAEAPEVAGRHQGFCRKDRPSSPEKGATGSPRSTLARGSLAWALQVTAQRRMTEERRSMIGGAAPIESVAALPSKALKPGVEA